MRDFTTDYVKQRIQEYFLNLYDNNAILRRKLGLVYCKPWYKEFILEITNILNHVKDFKNICCIGGEFVYWILPLFGIQRYVILLRNVYLCQHVNFFICFGIKLDSRVHIIKAFSNPTEFSKYLTQFNPDLIILDSPLHLNLLDTGYEYFNKKKVALSYLSVSCNRDSMSFGTNFFKTQFKKPFWINPYRAKKL